MKVQTGILAGRRRLVRKLRRKPVRRIMIRAKRRC